MELFTTFNETQPSCLVQGLFHKSSSFLWIFWLQFEFEGKSVAEQRALLDDLPGDFKGYIPVDDLDKMDPEVARDNLIAILSSQRPDTLKRPVYKPIKAFKKDPRAVVLLAKVCAVYYLVHNCSHGYACQSCAVPKLDISVTYCKWNFPLQMSERLAIFFSILFPLFCSNPFKSYPS